METMQRAAITGIKQTRLLDSAIPEPKEDWALVKVQAVPLCTEYKGWLNGNEYSGHEAAGEVAGLVGAKHGQHLSSSFRLRCIMYHHLHSYCTAAQNPRQ